MQFTCFREGSRRVVARKLSGDRAIPIADVDDFYRDLPAMLQRARSTEAPSLELGDLELEPAVPRGARVIGIGFNYYEHATESHAALPRYPACFARWVASLSVDGSEVPVPVDEPGLDWEGELAVIIGRDVAQVTPEQAWQAVFGYAVFNDLSARVAQYQSSQFTLGKNADKSGVLGTVFTADSVGDPRNGLRLSTRVNGELVQDGNTKNMIFDVGALIAHLSRAMTLHAGDLIATGTVAGIGHRRTPPRYLVPGDRVEVTLDGLGSISNAIVAPPPPRFF